MKTMHLIALITFVIAVRVGAEESMSQDMLSAIAVSQLVLTQQAEFFKEIMAAAKATKSCSEGRASDFACPYPFTQVVDECFYVSKMMALNWEESRDYCHGMGGDLATPKNLYGLKVHLIEMRGPRSLWIGGKNQGPGVGWQWMSGIAVGNEDWIRQPQNNVGLPINTRTRTRTENCLSMRRDRHPVLDEVPCFKLKCFICQYRT